MGRRHRNHRKRLLDMKKVTRPKIETKVAQYLDDLGLRYKQNHKLDRFNVDFLVNGKYIIECYGDFWHCNPDKYEADYYNRGLKCEAQARWKRDETRQEELESMGFRFLALWESEIKCCPKACKSKIKKYLNGA